MDKINKNRLFLAGCVSLVVTAMTYAIRAGIIGQLGDEFTLSDTELGFVNSMAFWGFPVATIFGGLVYNTMGPKKIMAVAFFSHLVGIVLTIMAGGFWTLLVSTFFIGFANGAVEAGCNPLIASMYVKDRTIKLNKFHVWFPGGMVMGALISKFMTDAALGWQLQIAVMIIPTLLYGYLFFGQKFPKGETLVSDTSINIKNIFTPLFIFMAIIMTITATTELGTQQWIEKILGKSGASPMLILAMITGLMAIGRYFAGPIIKKFNPPGVLWISSIISVIALYLMSTATGGMVYVSAILFAIGIMYFWPTMLGFVSEYIPKSGALGLAIISGAGIFGSGIWQPVIGSWLDKSREIALASGLTPEDAELAAGQATIGNIVYFPVVLTILFGILFLTRKKLEERRVTHTS